MVIVWHSSKIVLVDQRTLRRNNVQSLWISLIVGGSNQSRFWIGRSPFKARSSSPVKNSLHVYVVYPWWDEVQEYDVLGNNDPHDHIWPCQSTNRRLNASSSPIEGIEWVHSSWSHFGVLSGVRPFGGISGNTFAFFFQMDWQHITPCQMGTPPWWEVIGGDPEKWTNLLKVLTVRCLSCQNCGWIQDNQDRMALVISWWGWCGSSIMGVFCLMEIAFDQTFPRRKCSATNLSDWSWQRKA